MKCLFCEIVAKRVESAIVFEDDLVMAFLDIMPINEGHCLVIPKKHYELLEDMDEESYSRLFVISHQILKKMKKTLPDVTAFNYVVANGEDAGQEIFHSHLHIIPRKPRDGFAFKFGSNYGKQLSIEERKTVANKILSK
ncbi:MAG: HIT family protein [Promethearchaeota archaeon]